MVLAFCVAFLHQADLQVSKLSSQRGAFERQYVSPKRESLQITENLGTNNLGNPGRLWLYPVGSAAYRVWLCEFGGYEEADPKTGKDRHVARYGYLVYQSRHGKVTTTDWALRLVEGGKGAQATGTLSKFIRLHGYRVAQAMSAAQRRVLGKQQAYVAMSPGRGENWGIYTWFVLPSGRPSNGYYACFPDVENSTSDLDSILNSPPILPEEAKAMGLRLDRLWHGPGKFTAEYETDFRKYDFSS